MKIPPRAVPFGSFVPYDFGAGDFSDILSEDFTGPIQMGDQDEGDDRHGGGVPRNMSDENRAIIENRRKADIEIMRNEDEPNGTLL